MSDGKTHDLIVTGTAVLLSIVASPVLGPITGVMLGVGCLGGLVLSPDLDLGKNNARRRWRNMGLGWLWEPYDRAFKHRSFWSHTPVLGTWLRICYIGWLPMLFFGLPPLALIAGLCIADFTHWVLDYAF